MSSSLLTGLEIDDLEAFFAAIQEAADQLGSGFILALADGAELRILHASNCGAMVLGYAPDELRGKPFQELMAPEELERIGRIVRERSIQANPKPALVQSAVIRKDGTCAPIEVGTHRLLVGGHALVFTFVKDISERLRAEEELRSSEKRFRAVVENAPDGVAILRERKIAYLNPMATQMLGFSSVEHAIGTDISAVLIPDHAAKAKERIAQTLRIGRTLHPATEYTVKDSGIPPRTCEVVSVPIEFEGGPAVIGFARDITERKEMHEKLARTDRLASIGALAGAVAHEINNPLAGMSMALEQLARELGDAGIPEDKFTSLVERVSEAQVNLARVERIVRNLRGTSHPGPEKRGPVDVRAALERAIAVSENEIRHRARLIRSYSPTPPTFGDPARLEQVLLNLLVNAVQAFTDPTREENQIRVGLSLDEGRIAIEVSDTGAGTAPEVAIARQIIGNFGGSLEAEHRPGEGTTVRVHLPPHDTPDYDPSDARRTILLIDDEPVIRTLFTKLLEPIHAIETADSARMALTILEERRDFDAILCDVMMPGTNGRQLYETIRERWPGTERRIAFITGGVFDPGLSRFLATVPNLKLLKPFQLTDVLRTVEQIALATS